MKQVITIGTSGVISGLQHKPGKGVDLRSFGPAKVERVSEIVASEDGQRWFIEIKTGPLVGQKITTAEVAKARVHPVDIVRVAPSMDVEDGLLTFRDYDEAVKVEIMLLDALRVQGVF